MLCASKLERCQRKGRCCWRPGDPCAPERSRGTLSQPARKKRPHSGGTQMGPSSETGGGKRMGVPRASRATNNLNQRQVPQRAKQMPHGRWGSHGAGSSASHRRSRGKPERGASALPVPKQHESGWVVPSAQKKTHGSHPARRTVGRQERLALGVKTLENATPVS